MCKLIKYYLVIYRSYRYPELDILDYREFNKKDLEDYDVPEWGPEAPILIIQSLAGLKPSYEQTLYILLDKYRNPLPLAVLGFTSGSKFTKKKRSWSGSTEDLGKALVEYYPRPGHRWPTYCPEIRPTPEDPENKEAERLFDETHNLLMNLWRASNHRRFHELMKTCAYIVREVGIKVSWRKVPWVVIDPEGVRKSTKKTRWTIEAPRWCP